MAEGTMPMTLPKLLAGAQLSHLQSQETLGTAELREAVRCPASVDEDTWIAAQMKEIFVEAVRMVHFMGEFCHESRCPKMCAGDSTEYKWAEEGTAAAPESMPAISYMQRLIDWADRKLLDQALVPCDGSPMPASLRPELATMLRRLFRIYAHAYVHHFAQIQAVGAEAHVNCSFKHFLFFVLEFKLVRMEEMLPLDRDRSSVVTIRCSDGGASLTPADKSCMFLDPVKTSLMKYQVSPGRKHRVPCLKARFGIVDVYNSCHEEYVYSTTSNPKRTLTWPSEGLHNGGLDNSEHNYIGHVGDEILNQETGKSYELLESLGQGSFGQVLKCQVDQRLVALKIIKNRPSYFNQGCIEANVLKRLNSCFDPEDQYHIVRMLDCFVFKKHLCIAFELLELNLLEFLKWNSYKGFALPTIQSVTRQLLEAMICVVQASLIHCDLKPENVMVVSMTPIRIKLIDFGSACTESCPRHAYIQSRFYRSPEVILGLPYGSAIDIWSLGCIVAELLLGLPLFPGQCEYDQLRCIVKIMGLPPKEMLSAGSKSKRYFKRVDEAFVSTEEGRGGEECCEGPAEQVTTISTVASTATTADTELTVQVEVEVELEGSQANPQGPAQMDVWKEADHEQRATQMLQVQEPRRTTSWRLKTGDEYENDSNKKAARSRRAWPFTSIEEVVKDVPEENRGCLLQFLMGLFQMDPNGRWTARQALQHPFINEDAPFSEGFRPPQELRPGAAGLQGLSPNVNVNCRRAKPAPSSTTGTPASSPNHSSTGSVRG
ncbi:unnamed protein product [Durusdinium trenchii]|uniref:Protein kinase domain-containing protein n=1 Tax=Durusdinium trenchii TaxID=1381693 RepID=A0ABP0S611_9DINO